MEINYQHESPVALIYFRQCWYELFYVIFQFLNKRVVSLEFFEAIKWVVVRTYSQRDPLPEESQSERAALACCIQIFRST